MMQKGAFNPKYRDALRGNQDDGNGGGFIFNQQTGGSDWYWSLFSIMQGARGAIRGSDTHSDGVPRALGNVWDPQFANIPSEDINYMTCHDGLCFWDKILAWAKVTGNIGNTGYLKRIDEFGIGILLTSQGVPFFQSGDEFLRTKNGDHNSYCSSLEINQIDWSFKKQNKDVFAYYQAMIQMRKNHPALWLSTWNDVNNRVQYNINATQHALELTIDGSGITGENWKKAVIVYCSGSPNNYWVHLGIPPAGCEWAMVMSDGNPYDDKGTVYPGNDDRWVNITSGTAVFMFVARPKN